MLLRRQDVIDRFDANFCIDSDGQILFQPRRSKYSAPVTFEVYHAVISAIEKRQTISMALTWIAFFTAGVFGFYHVIYSNNYLMFFAGIGIAFLFSFSMSFRDATDLLKPFIERRDALRKMVQHHSDCDCE